MNSQANFHRAGTFVVIAVGGERVRAFLSSPPSPEPPLRLDALYQLMEEANRGLGRLDGVTMILPDTVPPEVGLAATGVSPPSAARGETSSAWSCDRKGAGVMDQVSGWMPITPVNCIENGFTDSSPSRIDLGKKIIP